jgi:hypothetical protein
MYEDDNEDGDKPLTLLHHEQPGTDLSLAI